jgi:FkbM family methyltransferase
MGISNFLKFFCCLTYLFILGNCSLAVAEDYITVEKKGVLHKFVRVDEATDHFTQNIFKNWENETFDVFDTVKDTQSIAIDMGAWIGTTAIWLSKNFHHVIAIEPDVESLKCLNRNLEASDCLNVSICDKPVAETAFRVLFGPRGERLNDSMSYIKKESDNINDYFIQSVTFKQLIYDYIYANDNINLHKISFIKCDIEGGEENILEDLLHFIYNNDCKAYVSFHLSFWKSKKITDFEYLFKFFKINCPIENVCKYIEQNPFASLLFEPEKSAGILIKNNLTALVIGYNQFTFIKNMVAQLEKYTSDIIVVDNNSDYQPLLDYYKNDFNYTLLKKKHNFGHAVYTQDSVQKLVGDLYVLTDPDLQFNPKLPDNFLQNLIDISNHFDSRRVGFALFIDSDAIRTDITYAGHSIKSWESQFWKNKLVYSPNLNIELYSADIDTTFCLINRRFPHYPIRVAGEYTCFHIPWHKNFQNYLEEGEYESYLKNNVSTN